MDLMANTFDGLESLGHINTAAAETVELDTSREDVRVLLKRGINRLGEGTLKGKSTFDFLIILVLVGLASSIITAVTRAVLRRASDNARSIARARLITLLADTHVKELVGKRLADNLADHAVNAETDFLLSLESGVVLSRGFSLIVVLSKSVRDKILRDSGLVSLDTKTALRSSTDIGVLHEAEEGQVLEAEITILARRGGRLSSGIVVRVLKDGAEVGVHAVVIDGLDPTMRPARSDIGAELGILKASIRGSRGRSRSGNVDVLREVLSVPHGARVASRHEEDKSLEHLLAGHGIEASGEIRVSEELVSGHSNDTSVTVIIVEDEDVIVLTGLKILATAAGRSITRKNIDEVLAVSILSNVILDNTSINIDIGTTLNVDLVVDLTRERIHGVVGNIILEESDDTLVRDTGRVSKLISLVDRGLVTIVTPAIATGDKNNPGLTTLGLASLNGLLEKFVLLISESNCNKCKCNKKSLHYGFLEKKQLKNL